MKNLTSQCFLETDIKVTEDQKYRVVIAYDISSNKRRAKISTILKKFGFRVQYSVFEATLNRKTLAYLRGQIEHYLEEHDNIKIICLANASKSWEHGNNKLEKNRFTNESLVIC